MSSLIVFWISSWTCSLSPSFYRIRLQFFRIINQLIKQNFPYTSFKQWSIILIKTNKGQNGNDEFSDLWPVLLSKLHSLWLCFASLSRKNRQIKGKFFFCWDEVFWNLIYFKGFWIKTLVIYQQNVKQHCFDLWGFILK